MHEKVANGDGFIAALDQSGGSTPGALEAYGVEKGSWSTDEEMFDLVHQMRSRIITSPAFTGDKIIGAILFEGTMDRDIEGVPSPTYLWESKGVVPFVKVDKGKESESDGDEASIVLLRPAEHQPQDAQQRCGDDRADRCGCDADAYVAREHRAQNADDHDGPREPGERRRLDAAADRAHRPGRDGISPAHARTTSNTAITSSNALSTRRVTAGGRRDCTAAPATVWVGSPRNQPPSRRPPQAVPARITATVSGSAGLVLFFFFVGVVLMADPRGRPPEQGGAAMPRHPPGYLEE